MLIPATDGLTPVRPACDQPAGSASFGSELSSIWGSSEGYWLVTELRAGGVWTVLDLLYVLRWANVKCFGVE